MSTVTPTVARPEFKNMFRNILLATDFSPCSQAIVPFARALARRHGSTVHILHAVHPEHVPGDFIPHLSSDEDRGAAQRKMDELACSEPFKDIPHTHLMKPGVVWDVVSEIVGNLEIDLVIVGNHGGHGLKHVVVGSVAEQILRHVTCPVLTVGPKISEMGLADEKISTILYATDFSSTSSDAINYALTLARDAQAELILLHAINPDEFAGDGYKGAVEKAERHLLSLLEGHSGLRCQVVVESGHAAQVILRKSQEFAANLIVMGAHGGFVAAHKPWTVAHQVICDAHCPVLSLRDNSRS